MDENKISQWRVSTASACLLFQHRASHMVHSRFQPKEWEKLELMHDVLQSLSISKKLGKTWLILQSSMIFSTAIKSGLDNICKWYHKINETDVYFICLALNPNYKVAYVKGKWEPRDFDEGMKCLQKVFNKCYHHTSLPDTELIVVAPSSLAHQGSYGHSWMRNAVKSRVASDTTNRRPCQELDNYLAAPLEDVKNIVAWWGGSAVASERVFLSSGITRTMHRNCLLPSTFEALQLLKSGYRQGHISATAQAEFATAHEYYVVDMVYVWTFEHVHKGLVQHSPSLPEPDLRSSSMFDKTPLRTGLDQTAAALGALLSNRTLS
ncbi:hypothetical protein DFJ58DRAFT_844168 [Suillus subalutaceus]|uniref:uncharacterized protein n=1 Tax=Suillus subalutaceus TaxID=48586 RepID=UPI001B86C531|nr:uncharacterized protein DFJ58DRAFT_844168 [Suillus subalutaceus]KAG1843931.1 hypothetical protein DFJ58DRAFT_844168 [Suillus subalutaceus]